MTKPATQSRDLVPPNWVAIEQHYRAGVLSVRSIAERFGVSHTIVNRRAKADGWTRNLKVQVQAKAEHLVSTGQVSTAVSKTSLSAAQVETAVNASAEALAIVLMGQRKTIERARAVGERLLAQLEETLDTPELAAMVYDALGGEGQACADLARFITGLPDRARVLKSLTETLGIAIGLERQSYGLNKEEDGSIPTAIIKDYTGLDDPDSPGRDTDREEEEA